MTNCPCNFVAPAGVKPTSPDWHRAHKEQHLRRYPRCDSMTIANLDQLVRLAEHGELRAEQGFS